MNNYMYNKEFLRVNGVDLESSIDTFGEEMYKETIDIFIKEMNERLVKMNEALLNNNLKDYTTYVHAIKGECGYLGFKELARQSLSHQLSGEKGDIEYIKNNYQSLINEIARVLKVSKIYLGQENIH